MSQIDLQWFAAEDEGRTEDPTEYKIRKAREEGRVAKSQEVNGAVVMLLAVVVLFATGKWALESLAVAMEYFFQHCTESLTYGTCLALFYTTFAKCVLPVALAAVAGGVLANVVQNRGFLFTWKPLQPQFNRILPNFGEYFRKTIFSPEGIFNVIKSLIKVLIIAVVSFFMIRSDINELRSMMLNDQVYHHMGTIAQMAFRILIISALLFLVISVPDYFVQRYQFIESLKMTKQEVKEEYKEMEGDPEVKSHLKSAQQELLKQNIPAAVKKSDVVIANPTHYAVALFYDANQFPGPQVTAKGTDEAALTIRRYAEEYGVPVEENRSLARELYTQVEIGDIIPEKYFTAVSVVYGHFLNEIQNKK